MKLIKNFSWTILLMWMVGACLAPPDYPITPQISIVNEELSFGKNPAGLDSLEIVLNFTDGDGDLGLPTTIGDAKDDQVYYYFIKPSGEIELSTLDKSNINYKFKRLNPKYELPDRIVPSSLERPYLNKPDRTKKLPNFESPYSCNSWEVKKKSNGDLDTIYFERNANSFNVFVDYFIRNDNDNKFKEFKIDSVFTYPRCGDISLNGARMPILSKDPSKKAPLDGKIRFWIRSFGFEASFGAKTIKIQVSIQDRALHRSNIVESKEFSLLSIRKR